MPTQPSSLLPSHALRPQPGSASPGARPHVAGGHATSPHLASRVASIFFLLGLVACSAGSAPGARVDSVAAASDPATFRASDTPPSLPVQIAAEPTPSSTSTPRPVPLATASPSRQEVLSNLQQQIESLIAMAPSGTWGVVVKELASGETVDVRADEVFHPASTIKVGIAMDLLYWMERHPEVKWTNGPQPNQRSFGQLLDAMLVKSEETATVRLAAFLDAQPGYHLVDQWQSWGVTHTTFIPRRTTPADLARLLELLYKEEVLTHASSLRIIQTMRIPKASQSERIGAGLPAEVRAHLANKSGTTFENLAGVVADTGIVVAGNKVLVIVVVGNRTGSADYEQSMHLIGEIARAAFITFVGWPEPVMPASPHGEIP